MKKTEHLVKMTYTNSKNSLVWAYPSKQSANKAIEQMTCKFPSIKAEYVGVKLK